MRQGFYYDNEDRAYPFVDAATRTLPDAIVVDCHTTLGLGVSTSSIHLASVARAGSVYTFTFAGAAMESPYAGLPIDLALKFEVDAGDGEFSSYEGAASVASDDSAPPQRCSDDLIWDGMLTVGRPAGLADLVADGDTLTVSGMVLEPALTVDLSASYVRSVQAANRLRLHATAPSGCTAYDDPSPVGYVEGDYYMWPGCIRPLLGSDPLRLREGYGVSVAVAPRDNSITIAAATGPSAGSGPPCSEPPVYPGEPVVAGSPFRSGGPACSEVVSSINGVSARRLRLIQGPGVTIKQDPGDVHGIIIDFDLHDMFDCPS